MFNAVGNNAASMIVVRVMEGKDWVEKQTILKA